jgi:N-acyl-L-homoserine lactone synthetase
VMTVEIASPKVWECTRIVISDELTTHDERQECMEHIIDGVVSLTLKHGADQVIGLSSVALMRWLRGLGYPVGRLGEPYRNREDGRQYAVLHMPAEYSRAWKARAAMAQAFVAQQDWDMAGQIGATSSVIHMPVAQPYALSA